jgi:hypothetical protein
MDDKPVSKDLDRLLGIYDRATIEELSDDRFMSSLRKLIVRAQHQGASYEAERAAEWERIAYALGDNEPVCSGFGHWAEQVEKHSEAFRKIIEESN